MPELNSPYPLRKGQGELVEFISDTFESQTVGMAHAPTGIGKTLAALLASLPNLSEKGKILYAVNRKNQIPIILKELREINRENSTNYRAVAFASKADLCRDPEIKKLGYRELLEACEARRMNNACSHCNALFSDGFLASGKKERREISEVARELQDRILREMPPPHAIEKMARAVEAEFGARPVCIYELLKLAAKNAEVLVGTFWYYFHPIVARHHLQSLSLERDDCLLVCDEAHNLPRFCREALSNGLSLFRIRYAIRELGRNSVELEERGISAEGIGSFLRTFSELYSNFKFTFEGRHLPGGLARVFLRRRGITAFEGPVESLEAAGAAVLEARVKQGLPPRSHLAVVANFVRPFLLQEARSYERLCVLVRTGGGNTIKRLEIRCLDPAPLAGSVLDPGKSGGARASFLMSGTLVPGDYYRDILGVPFARHMEFPNIFPRENRALFLDDTVSLAWKSRSEDMYDSISQKMVLIRKATPGGCMFFFPSYEVMEGILKRHPDRKILVEKRASTKRDEVEEALKEEKSVLAVMGASLSEGLDLPGLIRAIAVFGLPLEKISDLMKLGMRYYNGQYPGRGRDYFYYLPAVTKIVQSAGRAHRQSSDKAAIYVFDKRFCRQYLGSAPNWWREEAIKIRGDEELVRATEEFWSGPMETPR